MTVLAHAETTAPVDASARRRPDHVLGVDVRGSESVSEVLSRAELDWGITTVDGRDGLSVIIGTEERHAFAPDRKLLLRDDNRVVLSMVGLGYTPIENCEAFALADVAKSLGATFAGAGESDHGRKTFVTMDLPDATINVDGGKDLLAFQIRFRTDHKGTGSVIGETRGRRLICTNGMMDSVGVDNKWVIPHTASASERLMLAETTLRGSMAYARALGAIAAQLISAPMSHAMFLTYIDGLFPRPQDTTSRAHTIWERRRADLLGLFQTSQLQQTAPNTSWAALNAVTEYDQWSRASRSPETRARRQFDGASDRFADNAYRQLRDLIDA